MKQTKLVAVLSAAALLAIGASMTSFAGWEQTESGAWQYVDKDGEIVENEWKKDGGKWFYLNDDGEMETSAWVDGEYYVMEDGHRATNEWVYDYAEDDDEDDVDAEEHWFYFDSKGKKIVEKSKKIAGKTYRFDDKGAMVSGWYTDDEGNTFYYGEENDGARKNSQWLWLEVDEDLECNDCNEEAWYWFDAKGKAAKSGSKKINGKTYFFNEHGQMLYEWINGTEATKPALDGSATPGTINVNKMLYAEVEEDGSRVGGWKQIAGSEDAAGEAADVKWYFFKDGKAKNAEGEGLKIFKINWKADGVSKSGKFCFNEKGEMQTGLRRVGDTTYYFDGNGYMKTGKITCDDKNDDTFTFYFNTKNTYFGEGYTGIKDGYLYIDGQRCEAEDKYVTYTYEGKAYLVNKNGKVQKKKVDIELDNMTGKFSSDEHGVVADVPADKQYKGGFGKTNGYAAKTE